MAAKKKTAAKKPAKKAAKKAAPKKAKKTAKKAAPKKAAKKAAPKKKSGAKRKPNLWLGVGYEYWHNKFGVDGGRGSRTSTPTVNLEFTF